MMFFERFLHRVFRQDGTNTFRVGFFFFVMILFLGVGFLSLLHRSMVFSLEGSFLQEPGTVFFDVRGEVLAYVPSFEEQQEKIFYSSASRGFLAGAQHFVTIHKRGEQKSSASWYEMVSHHIFTSVDDGIVGAAHNVIKTSLDARVQNIVIPALLQFAEQLSFHEFGAIVSDLKKGTIISIGAFPSYGGLGEVFFPRALFMKEDLEKRQRLSFLDILALYTDGHGQNFLVEKSDWALSAFSNSLGSDEDNIPFVYKRFPLNAYTERTLLMVVFIFEERPLLLSLFFDNRTYESFFEKKRDVLGTFQELVNPALVQVSLVGVE